METKENKIQKTQIYNVIILDRSGSMDVIRRAAVDGFNETLAGIKKAQEQYGDTQEHFVSLVTFCSCKMKQVYDKTPAFEAKPLDMRNYQPCCCTPLYDAMGFTINSIRKDVKGNENAVVVVTIITDGLENASKEYNGYAIKNLVEQLKVEGWTFTYMGANQDALEVASNLSIRNARNFDYSEDGTAQAMRKDSNVRSRLYERLSDVQFCCPNHREIFGSIANAAFDEEDD